MLLLMQNLLLLLLFELLGGCMRCVLLVLVLVLAFACGRKGWGAGRA